MINISKSMARTTGNVCVSVTTTLRKANKIWWGETQARDAVLSLCFPFESHSDRHAPVIDCIACLWVLFY